MASETEEPVFTIQTSMPPSPIITPSPPYECFSNGSTFLCPTATITASESVEEEPVFCPAPTSLPSGLCYSTVTYTISSMSEPTSDSGSTLGSKSGQVNASITSSVRLYPCEESTTVYSSQTYAINCLDDQDKYIACPTSITVTLSPSSACKVDSAPTPTFTCLSKDGTEITCISPMTRTRVLTACIDEDCRSSTTSPTRTTTRFSSGVNPTSSTSIIISQCYNQNATRVPCPTLCSDPFGTAPGPVVPTATLTMEEDTATAESKNSTSEKIFQTSPAPIIRTFARLPAVLTVAPVET